jgi:hypothetical protein
LRSVFDLNVHHQPEARQQASDKSRHLKTADVLAAEYGVASTPVRQDAGFAAALDRVAGHCGEEVRQQVLARAARWTRRDVERLAKLDAAALRKVVAAARAAHTVERMQESSALVPAICAARSCAGEDSFRG